MPQVLKCARCGYESEAFHVFKKHLETKVDCEPEKSNISMAEVKEQFKELLDAYAKRTESPKKEKKKKRLRAFGDECRDYIKRDAILDFKNDPLLGIQSIIIDIYFNDEHEENHTVRLCDAEKMVEIHNEDDKWVRVEKKKTFDKMIYRAANILENNIFKKHWTPEFRNFITSMNEFDNDTILEVIREEVDNTIITIENNKKEKDKVKT